MPSENLHAPRERLTKKTLHPHYAIASLMEELEAVDWYRQGADDTEDANLRAVLIHNANEEIEYAAMVLKWIRRREPKFDEILKTYLFTTGPITEVEEIAEGKE